MKQVIISLTEDQETAFRYWSFERFINNASRVGRLGTTQLDHQGDREDASALHQDADDFKYAKFPALWDSIRNAIIEGDQK